MAGLEPIPAPIGAAAHLTTQQPGADVGKISFPSFSQLPKPIRVANGSTSPRPIASRGL
jgi:hypothetical protein